MLILAGVSLNAIIGDNGIIMNAQNANILQSCAVLEEFLGEKYVEYALADNDELIVDEREATALEKLFSVKRNWFYNHGSYNYVIYDYQYTDDDGAVHTTPLTLYLINKSNLAKDEPELTSSLKGGDADGNNELAYLNFQDVYGVTNDLKVYYCSDGLASAVGASFTNSSAFDTERTIYSKDSGIAKAIANSLGKTESEDLSISSLHSVKELTISASDGISDLSALYELSSLTKLTLTNYTGKLEGIEYATKLVYLYFKNNDGTQNIDYEGLRYTTKLQTLYFYNPTNTEVNHLFTEMGNADYNDLDVLGLYGYMGANESPTYAEDYFNDTHSSLNTLTDLGLLTENTRKRIHTLYAQNNALISLNGVQYLYKLNNLLVQQNPLNDISNLSSLTDLINLKIQGALNTFTSLAPIDGLTKLEYIRLTNANTITSLKECITNEKKLTSLYALGLKSLDFETNTTFWTVANKSLLGGIYTCKLEPIYSSLFANMREMVLSKDMTDLEFRDLANNQYIEILDLNGNTNIMDDSLQLVLPSLPKLKNLLAAGSNLASLDFCNDITNKTLLTKLDIRGTSITSILPLSSFTRLHDFTVSANSSLKIYDENDEEFNEENARIISNICNAADHGFVCSTGSVLTQLEKLEDLTYYGGYAVSITKNLDLSDTSLIKVWSTMYNTASGDKRGTLILPDTIQEVRLHAYNNVELTSDKNLQKIYFNWEGNRIVIDNLEAEDGQYSIVGESYLNLKDYNYANLFTSKVNKISFDPTDNRGERDFDKNEFSSSLLTNATYCTSMNFNYIKFTHLDGADFPDSVNSLTISNSKLQSFKNVSEMTGLTYLNLKNNLLGTLPDFYDIDPETCALQQLVLSNCSLQNLTTVGSGENKDTISTTSILARIPSLTYINLSDNDELTDFQPLLDAGFTDNGSHIFRR